MMRKILFALVALAACADNSSTDNDDNAGDDGSDDGSGGGGGDDDTSAAERQQDYDDVAVLIGANLSAGDLVAMIDSVNMAYGRMPEGFTVTQGPDFQLVEGARGNLAIQYKLFCRDAADLYAPCDGNEDHAHVHPVFSGSVSAANTSMDNIDREASWIVRDTLQPTPRIGGTGTHAFASNLPTGSYVLDVDDKLNAIRFAAAPSAPVSGGMDLTINVKRNRASANPPERIFDVVARIAFDGDDNATIVLDSTQNYTWTFATGVVVKAQ